MTKRYSKRRLPRKRSHGLSIAENQHRDTISTKRAADEELGLPVKRRRGKENPLSSLNSFVEPPELDCLEERECRTSAQTKTTSVDPEPARPPPSKTSAVSTTDSWVIVQKCSRCREPLDPIADTKRNGDSFKSCECCRVKARIRSRRGRPSQITAAPAEMQDEATVDRMDREKVDAAAMSIYSGLTMTEAKCIQTVASQQRCQLTDEQWRALISFHQTLLYEHHNFYLASWHPSASPELKRLATTMPARLWRNALCSPLELLRCHLPSSREYMRTFIYFAYPMMTLFLETVPRYQDTWIECLGHLGIYRMEVENDDPYERSIWAGITQSWYCMAATHARAN